MKKTSKSASYKTGKFAETVALLLLSCKFYRILEKRYKTKLGEIDIIALRGRQLVFVEVKLRADKNALYESITNNQQQRITRAAELFLAHNRKYENHFKRFDAIFITKRSWPVHLVDVW